MHSHEWPLIGFTLAAQGAVGIVVILSATYPQLTDRVGDGRSEHLAGITLIIVLVLLVLSGVTATMHLGKLRNVYLVLANWRTSWLSREVLMVGVFTAAVAAYATMHLAGVGRMAMRVSFGAVAGFIGLALIVTIARLYMLHTVPVWNRAATPLTFFATTLVFGLVGVAFAIALLDGGRAEGIQQLLSLLALVVLAAQLTVFTVHRRALRSEEGAAAISSRLIDETLIEQVTWRIALAVGGALVLLPTALGLVPSRVGLTVAALLIVVSEILGRHVFYASYARSGL